MQKGLWPCNIAVDVLHTPRRSRSLKYFDKHGLQCGFGCGRGCVNRTCPDRHISKDRCSAIAPKAETKCAIICPTPPLGGVVGECPLDGAWENLDLTLFHCTRYYATDRYRAGIMAHSCLACKATFAIREMFIAHFRPLSDS
jgi:hypothetical protein